VLKQALLQATGSVLIPAFLPESFAGAEPAAASPDEGIDGFFRFESFIEKRLQAGATDLYAEVHRQLDRILLPQVFQFSGGNQRQTARVLGIARQTLRTKLEEAGLNLKRFLDDSSTDKE
jgi:DNA-binding NtrC family response regulator